MYNFPYNIQEIVWDFDLTLIFATNVLTLLLGIILCSSLVVYAIDILNRDRFLPPGPRGLPIVGRLPWMKHSTLPSQYSSLADRYGDIFSIRLGSRLVVCISSPKILKEYLNTADAISRPITPYNNLYRGYGIIMSEGDVWNEERQFIHEKMHELGVKMSRGQKFEKRILTEVIGMLFDLNKKPGRAMNPMRMLERHVHNVICQLMMTFRFSKEDPIFKNLTNRMKQVKKLYASIFIGEYFPVYMILPWKRTALKKIKYHLDCINKFYEEILIGRSRVLKPTSPDFEPMDLLDSFLLEIIKNSDDLPEKAKQTLRVMHDLVTSATENTRTAISWLIVMMLREKKVADKVRAEIGKVTSRKHLVTLRQSTKMPYLEAVILETLRITSVVPLGTSHVNLRKWQIGAYIIPAGTTIIPLINKINMDPKLFPEPEKFIPERFLVDGKVYVPDYFMPFGVGKRICLGQQLAKMQLFLFFANLMNYYQFILPVGQKVPPLQGVYDTVHRPVSFSVIFKKF